jgi:hypothetical protein
LQKLRGVRVRENGVDVANAGRVLGLDFLDSAITYDPLTGYVTIELGGAVGDLEIATLSGASNTLQLTHARKLVRVSHTSATTLTVPANVTAAFPVGSRIVVEQDGAGQLTIAEALGVTIRTPGTLSARAQYSTLVLIKLATNEWLLLGDLQSASGTTSLARDTSQTFGFGSYDTIGSEVPVEAGDALLVTLELAFVESANAPGTYTLNFEFSENGDDWTTFRTVGTMPVEGATDANAELFIGTGDHSATLTASHGSHNAGFVRVQALASVAATTAGAVCVQVVNQPA